MSAYGRSGLLPPSGNKDKLQDVHQLSPWNFCESRFSALYSARELQSSCANISDLSFMCFDLLTDRRGSKVVCGMTPREQLRKMTALGEQGALDEKHWYRLVNGMSAGGGTC